MIYACLIFYFIFRMSTKKKIAKASRPEPSRMDTEPSNADEADSRPKVKKSSSFKDQLFLKPEGRILNTFDTYMLFIIGYSCFTSAYYVAFSAPTKDDRVLMWLEHLVFASYTLDIIFNFVRLPEAESL